MAEHLSQSELDYPFKLLEYFNGFRVSKVTLLAFTHGMHILHQEITGSILTEFQSRDADVILLHPCR